MEIFVNNKKKIEGLKPIFDFQGPTPVTIKTDQDFSSLSSSLYLAGSRVFKDLNKVLFFSTNYSISGNAITFMVDTYTENYLKYINELKTSFNLLFAARANGKTIFLLDKAFANPRVYVEGVPPSGLLSEYYTKPEVDDILSTNYWTKQQVAAAIAEIQTMDIEVLSALPPIEEAQEYTIYLVPAPSSEIGNFYDEYLVINGQFLQVGSTAIDMSQYALKSELLDYLPLSGGEISGELKLPNNFYFNRDGRIWTVNSSYNLFYGTSNYTMMKNQNIYLEGNTSTTSKVNIDPISGHLQYRGNNENTPGGFVIQDLSGKISAPYIEVTSGIIQNNVLYNVSDFLLRSEKSAYRPDYYFIRVENPSSGSWLFKLGDVNSPTIGLVSFYGNSVNLGGVSNVTIGYSANSVVMHGGANPNSPKGFSILDASGCVSASGFIQDGVKYDLSNLQPKIDSNNIATSSITLSSNTFLRITEPLTDIDLTIPSGLSDAIIFFKTGDTFEYSISYPSGSYINQDFDFSPSAAYIISVENDIILWSDLIEKE